MSTSEGDVRYQQHEVPSSLGDNPSKDALQAFFSSWGNAWICKIVNEGSYSITYRNPYYSTKGTIEAGKQEASDTTGWLPLSSTDKVYWVDYWNKNLNKWIELGITDVNRDWMLSFKTDGVEDLRDYQPVSGSTAELTLVVNDEGYKIKYCSYGDKTENYSQSSLAMRHFPRAS